MSASMKELGLDRLSVAERILLVEELWDSIAPGAEAFTLADTHRKDLDRRLEQYRDSPKSGSPWAEVKVRLQGKTN